MLFGYTDNIVVINASINVQWTCARGDDTDAYCTLLQRVRNLIAFRD